MSRRFLFFTAFFQWLWVAVVFANNGVTKGDTLRVSCNFENQGSLQWQFSSDLIFWHNIDGAAQPNLITLAEASGFYRARLKMEEQTLFSDTTFFYVEDNGYAGPTISDNDHTVRLSWDYALPRHLIDHFRVSIEGFDTVFILRNWHNFFAIDREKALYNKTITIEAVPDGHFSLPRQSVTYTNNYSRFFDAENRCIAHRGLSASYPENTAVAFTQAAEAGFTMVECDLWLTKDDVWVLNHDKTIDRTSNGKGTIADYYFDELRTFDFAAAKQYPNKSFEKILHLTEFLTLCREHHLKPLFEIKEDKFRYLNLVQLIATINQQLGYDQYAIQSFDASTLRKLRRIDPNAILGLLSKKIKGSHALTVENLYPCFYNIAFNKSFLEQPLGKSSGEPLDRLYQSGCIVVTWTVDNPASIAQLLSKGWWVMTDHSAP